MIGALMQAGSDSAGWVAALAACMLVLMAIGGVYTKLKVDIAALQKDFKGLDRKVGSMDREQAWQVRSLYRIMHRMKVKPPDGFDGHHVEGNGDE